ncbi:MAG: lipoprotein [Pseudazoarcus pumilus]|nr:lipoprotein [Pseudazoarcus pumilus]
MRPYTFIVLLASALLIAGCGIKGNLYMPDIPSAKPAAEPAADDSKAPKAPAANPA